LNPKPQQVIQSIIRFGLEPSFLWKFQQNTTI